MPEFLLGSRDVLKGEVPFVIEEAQANVGRFHVALEMIEAAARTGADAIEFQLAIADDFYVAGHPLHKTYSERQFSNEQILQLVEAARSAGIGLVAAVFSPRLVDLLAPAGVAAFNVNASDLTNPEMIDAIASSGRPFFMALPLATPEEIDWAVARARSHAPKAFALLLGQHTMATGEGGVPAEATSLGAMASLREKYGVPVGFIDHTSHQWMPSVAVAAGAAAVTKHMALSRAERGPDWHICLEPDEMAQAVRMVRAVTSSVYTSDKVVAEGEMPDRRVMRRSIVARQPLAAGHRISREDVAFKRPGTGIEPLEIDRVVGSVAGRAIPADEPFGWDALQTN